VPPSDSSASSSAYARLWPIHACGTNLCRGPWLWRLHGASVYGHSSASDAVNRARVLRLNTIRLTDWLDTGADPVRGAYDESRWRTVDADLALARESGLRVILDLSTYRNMLYAHGINPYTYDWKPFLSFVANRRNTVNGNRIGSDPVIALVSFAGEVEPLNTSDNRLGITTKQVTGFFRTAFATWGSLAPEQLRSSGGLLQLDWDSGIDWRSIMALPGSDVCSIHVYGDGDKNSTLPAVANYCRRLGKPWITEEFGMHAGIGDATRASWFTSVYDAQRRYGSAGAGFWNAGPQVGDTYDVGAQTPLTAAVVRKNAP